MPRIKPNNDELKNRAIRAYISKNMDLYAISEEEVAVNLRCTKRTFQNKRKKPETFTLKELRSLCTLLKFKPEEKSEVL